MIDTAKEWNEKYPIGTLVMYRPAFGLNDFFETETTSEAWNLCDSHPVVKIRGRSGGVSIYHLKIGHSDDDCQHKNIITGTQWNTCRDCHCITDGFAKV